MLSGVALCLGLCGSGWSGFLCVGWFLYLVVACLRGF